MFIKQPVVAQLKTGDSVLIKLKELARKATQT